VYGIARTLFLVCLLGLGSFLIHADTYRLVLQPVQRMVERVREMAEDPLMLAAARTTPMGGGSAGSTALNSSSGGTGSGAKQGSAYKLWAMHQRPGGRASAATDAGGSNRSSQAGGGKAASKIRFGPAVRVHAVAEDAVGEAEQCGGSSVLQPPQLPPSVRVSSTQLVAVQARRLSANLAMRLSAAGRAAGRLRSQLLLRAAAFKKLLVPAVCSEEGAAGGYETRLLEQSIYKICALLAVGFGDAGAEVIAENIKQEGDLNPCMPGRKTVSDAGCRVASACTVQGSPLPARQPPRGCVATRYPLPLPPPPGGCVWLLRHTALHRHHRGAAGGRHGVCQQHRTPCAQRGHGARRGGQQEHWRRLPAGELR
jgi:hypothetical protein